LRYVITGASGNVGQGLVPLLHHSAAELLIIGREPNRLGALFPGIPNAPYDEIQSKGRGFDAIIHLATLNTDADATEEDFYSANVEFSLEASRASLLAGIDRFIFVSSTHALDEFNVSPYAESKRQAVVELSKIPGINLSVIYLPAVQTTSWAGKFSALNNLPPFIARNVFSILSAFKPTLKIETLANYIVCNASTDQRFLTIITDDKDENFTYRAFRRGLDLAFAISVIVFFWWVMLGIWIAIKMTSKGPGIFAQRRVGKNGQEFVCLKFRTMKVGTIQVGTHEVSQSSVTPIGALLRRWKLDELPQIWNILRKEITLIGPRPCLPSQAELIELRKKQGVLKLTPGISGLAQVNGIDMSDPVTLVQWDARYLALRSIILDLKICVATAFGRGRGDRIKN
jgi:lipopolysaccharide/colanic/teichoic acid biosynthesis glycosyltransferase